MKANIVIFFLSIVIKRQHPALPCEINTKVTKTAIHQNSTSPGSKTEHISIDPNVKMLNV